MEMFETEDSLTDLHPCQYCERPCKGKQCRECHFDMLAYKQGQCCDCNKVFTAIRKDGSIKKRCNECQYSYNLKHISICPSCGLTYHAYLSDGRIFDKCYKCYQSSITKCQNCDKFAFNGYALCKQCYQETKKSDWEEPTIHPHVKRKKYQFDDIISGILPCKKLDCLNFTNSTFCKECHNEYKIAK